MLDLGADDCIHRVLVPVPVLTAAINHSTVGTFNNIPEHTVHTCTYGSVKTSPKCKLVPEILRIR